MVTRLIIFPLHITIHVSAHKLGVVNSKHTHYKQWTHTWSSGPFFVWCPGSDWGLGVLLKGRG